MSRMLDTGAPALAFLLNLIGIPADAQRIRHLHGSPAEFDASDLLRASRGFAVKARAVRMSWAQLARAPLPALARMNDERWLVVGRVADDRLLAQDMSAGAARSFSQDQFEAEWDGTVMVVARRAPIAALHARFGIAWFVAAIAKYRRPLSEVLVASCLLQVLGLLAPLFFQVVVDKVLVHRGLSTLEVLSVGFGLLSLFEVVLGGLRTWLFAHTTNRIDVELGGRLFRHLLALPLSYFGARRVGDTVARVRELETIRQFLTSSALTLVLDLAFGAIFVAVLLNYSLPLTLVVLLSLPLYAALSAAATPAFHRRIEEKFARGAENQSLLVETVAGVETVKSMALEPVLQRRWEEQLAAYVGASFGVTSLGNLAQQAAQAIHKLVTVLILFLGARAVMRTEMTVGELVAFNMLAGQVTAPVLRLAHLWQDFQQTRVSIDRLGDILNTPPEPAASAQAGPAAVRGAIRFEEATFRYRIDGAPVLRDVTLDIPAGQVVALVGPSGSGKSTLVKLVQRLYVPETGRVLVDGMDLALGDPSWLRRQLGVVLQDNVLFNRSVRENIALADPGMSMQRVIASATLAGAHDFILRLPQGYDTVVGERGASLSGGQRQRIAIARALAVGPRILILDEATSALDYESEAAIQRNMQGICEGRTVLIVAHRLSTIRGADRILVLEGGEIVEDGSHAALLAQGGRYAALHALQDGGHGR